jgi:glycosyltransferase involved in cell wall biosynthesis
MRILVCHERFLFRFGADRVMMLIAEGLAAGGHEIVVMTNRCDEKVVRRFASRVVYTPADRSNYIDLSEYSAQWLEDHWDSAFPDGSPDVVLHGGWPYFGAMPLLAERTQGVVFMDHGVVPAAGLPEETQAVLAKLKDLRRENLRHCAAITSVSKFLTYSQSFPDSAYSVPVHTIYNGADHMEGNLWRQELVGSTVGGNLEHTEKLLRSGKRLILALGRWETAGYKNSARAFDVLRAVLTQVPETVLLILANPAEVAVPEDLAAAVAFLEFPGDRELQEIMKLASLGISMSLWEGFNLPLAEMQWLGKGALVFDAGAHSEVVADPWYLCRNVEDMAAKAVQVLREKRTPRAASLAEFRRRFQWHDAVARYGDLIASFVQATGAAPASRESRPGMLVVVDVSNSTRDPANSGVIRVTRRFSRTLQDIVDPIFVVWDSNQNRYVLPAPGEFRQLGQYNGPLPPSEDRMSPSPEDRVTLDAYLSKVGSGERWLLCTETMNEDHFVHIRRYARERGFRIAAVFYDAIAVLRPDLCSAEIRDNHGKYMRGLAECDLVFPISHWSDKTLGDLWREWRVNPARSIASPLPGEFGGAGRNHTAKAGDDRKVRMLCVSTIEPRKNHRTLVAACKLLAAEHPEVDFELTLVGNRYAGAMELGDWLEGVCREDSRFRWLGIVSDEELVRLYEQSDFTVYPSVIEGYGLPIVESVWHGRPCICHREGVMAELASEGGCLTVDVTSPRELSNAIHTLATDPALRAKLSEEAVQRPILSWQDYSAAIVNLLRAPQPTEFRDWRDVLYPNCIQDGWQMEDSERTALTAVLTRHRPKCSIEIGTFRGGSLSLISQHSGRVYSLDIDPAVAQSLKHLSNVTFVTGDSGTALPKLLDRLSAQGIPVDFMLLDGDHSTEGVRRDLKAILAYRPAAPMFLLMHDSFNPDCRRGMIESDWNACRYCHWVDLDFVPGRRVEHGGLGTGEMWGGLGAAYFHPEPRQGDLKLIQSAQQMFQLMLQTCYGTEGSVAAASSL